MVLLSTFLMSIIRQVIMYLETWRFHLAKKILLLDISVLVLITLMVCLNTILGQKKFLRRPRLQIKSRKWLKLKSTTNFWTAKWHQGKTGFITMLCQIDWLASHKSLKIQLRNRSRRPISSLIKSSMNQCTFRWHDQWKMTLSLENPISICTQSLWNR